MSIKFHPNCKNEGSRWSATVKLLQVVIDDHNNQGKGTTELQRQRIQTVLQAQNEAIALAIEGHFWNPRVPDHVQDGIINYPSNLDHENEGSRGSFLIGLGHQLTLTEKPLRDPDVIAVMEALDQAEEDAKMNSLWDLTLEDIEIG